MDDVAGFASEPVGGGRRPREVILAELRALVGGDSDREPPPDPPASGLDDVFVLDKTMLVKGDKSVPKEPPPRQEYLGVQVGLDDMVPLPSFANEVPEGRVVPQKRFSAIRQGLTNVSSYARWGGRVAVEELGRLYTAKIPSWVAYSGLGVTMVLLCGLGAVKFGLFDQRTHEVAPAPLVAVAAEQPRLIGDSKQFARGIDAHIENGVGKRLEETRTDLLNQIAALKGQINALEADVDARGAQIKDLQTQMDRLNENTIDAGEIIKELGRLGGYIPPGS